MAILREETKKRIGKENNLVITGRVEQNSDKKESTENEDRRNVKKNKKEINMPRTDKIEKNQRTKQKWKKRDSY